jgi:hypothetical protein
MELIWAKHEAIYFCGDGWTGGISLIGLDKFIVWRRGAVPDRCAMSACPPIATQQRHARRRVWARTRFSAEL